MTFYQELQLSSAGSKQLIKNTTDKKEKRRHILIYNFKVYLVMTFCFALVTLYSMIFGSDNSVAGVVFLLALLVLRQADFGIRTHHGLLCIVGIFAILIVGPRVSNMVSPWAAFVINIGCIFTLMLLGCHNVIMYNHSTFVLGYLLLQGYDVTGRSYYLRVISLLVGMLICMTVFYKNQRIQYSFGQKLVVHQTDTGGFNSAVDFLTAGAAESHVGRHCMHVRLSAVFVGYCRTCQKARTL